MTKPRLVSAIGLALGLALVARAQSPDDRITRVFDNGNPGAVQNRPSRDTVFVLAAPARVTSITTYHWNDGRGGPGGTLALRSRAGETFGPWPVRVDQRVYWVAEPGVTIPAGTYTVVDSSPATWSHNAASGGAGMAWIEGHAVRATGEDRAPMGRMGPAESSRAGQVARPAPRDQEPSLADTTSVLFDGTLDARWLRHAAAGGNFERDARLEDGRGLVVDVAPNNGAGHVGLLSPKALAWLDDFGPEAFVTIRFRFDPRRTTGFSVALTVPHHGGVAGNPPAAPSVQLTWTRSVDGASSKLELHVNPHAEGAFRTLTLPPAAPREVVLTLRPYEIDWRVDGGQEIVDEFPAARVGQGFHVYAYSAAPKWHAPVSMALEEIALTRHPDPIATRKVQTVGKAPLFDGRENPAWEGFGVAGGDFGRFARYAGGALVVDVPKDNGWGKTGLMTVAPALHVERRSDRAHYRFIVRTDPQRTTGFVVALSPRRTPDMWPEHLVWISLIRSEAGALELFLHQTPYLSWGRAVTGSWNGELQVMLATDGIRAWLPGGLSIRTPLGVRDDNDYYLQVMAHPPKSYAPATLALKSVLRQRVLPGGLLDWERWAFLPPEEFAPDAFLRDVQADLALVAIGRERSTTGVQP